MSLAFREPWAGAILVAAALVAAATAAPALPGDHGNTPHAEGPVTPDEAVGFAAPIFGVWTGPRTVGGPVASEAAPTTEREIEVPIPSPPRIVRIRAIEVEAPIIDLGLTDDGALETPEDFDLAGWWAGGTPASHPGPTVIVGHVDNTEGPAVFFRLHELERGDVVDVVDDHDNIETFVVVERQTYDKDEFPTERVYGDTSGPTLRLITCGGVFDRSTRSYESNVVVYAELLPESRQGI